MSDDSHDMAGDKKTAWGRSRRALPWSGGRLRYYQDAGCPQCGAHNLIGRDYVVDGRVVLCIECVLCGDEFLPEEGMPLRADIE